MLKPEGEIMSSLHTDALKIANTLEGDEISCRFCGKTLSLRINRKDQLISFKNHLKQKHKISILDYFQLESD